MTAMRKIQIELPEDVAENIDRKVASGAYRDVSAVILGALDDLPHDDDDVVEHWLRTEVLPTVERMDREDGPGISGDEVKRRIRARHQAREGQA